MKKHLARSIVLALLLTVTAPAAQAAPWWLPEEGGLAALWDWVAEWAGGASATGSELDPLGPAENAGKEGSVWDPLGAPRQASGSPQWSPGEG